MAGFSRSLLVALVVCCNFWTVSPAHGADTAKSPLSVWSGLFHYVGGAKERTLIEAAIEEATEGLNEVMKRAARMRLEEVSRPYKAVRFEYLGDRFQSWIDGIGPWVSGVAGELIKERGRDGQRVEVSHYVGPTKLVQVIRTRQGQRTNVYSMSKDKKHMTLDVRIDGDKLPETVRFKLSYERDKG